MTFRWLILITLYTLLIGPIMDIPCIDAKAKARSQTNRPASNR